MADFPLVQKKRSNPWIWIGTAAMLFVAALVAFYVAFPNFVAILDGCGQNFHVPTASMEPAILVGDRVRANKCAYAEQGQPAVGDMVAFRYPRDRNVNYIKRIVAVGGDTLKYEAGILYRNGAAVTRSKMTDPGSVLAMLYENETAQDVYTESLGEHQYWVVYNGPNSRYFARDWPGPQDGNGTIPEGEVFVMGDNRDNATDSRMWGTVPVSDIIGKIDYVVWSLHPEDGHRSERLFQPIDQLGP